MVQTLWLCKERINSTDDLALWYGLWIPGIGLEEQWEWAPVVFFPDSPVLAALQMPWENEAGGCGGDDYTSLLVFFTLPQSLRDFPRPKSRYEELKAVSLDVWKYCCVVGEWS